MLRAINLVFNLPVRRLIPAVAMLVLSLAVACEGQNATFLPRWQ